MTKEQRALRDKASNAVLRLTAKTTQLHLCLMDCLFSDSCTREAVHELNLAHEKAIQEVTKYLRGSDKDYAKVGSTRVVLLADEQQGDNQ